MSQNDKKKLHSYQQFFWYDQMIFFENFKGDLQLIMKWHVGERFLTRINEKRHRKILYVLRLERCFQSRAYNRQQSQTTNERCFRPTSGMYIYDKIAFLSFFLLSYHILFFFQQKVSQTVSDMCKSKVYSLS